VGCVISLYATNDCKITPTADDGHSAARIEEEVVCTAEGAKLLTLFPAEELVVTNA
jgi:hypothetical protein